MGGGTQQRGDGGSTGVTDETFAVVMIGTVPYTVVEGCCRYRNTFVGYMTWLQMIISLFNLLFNTFCVGFGWDFTGRFHRSFGIGL